MSEDARKGRRIVFILVAALLLPNLAVLVVTQSLRTNGLRLARDGRR